MVLRMSKLLALEVAPILLKLIQYRLDDDSECFNPKEPNTPSCPLLPGQHVNVLDVPIQQSYPDSARNASLGSLAEQVFTLNPADKFTTPCPPSPSNARPSTPPKVYSVRSGSQGSSALSKMTRWTREMYVHTRPTSPQLMHLRSISSRRCPSEPANWTAGTPKIFQKSKRPHSAPANFKLWLPGRIAESGFCCEEGGQSENLVSLDAEAVPTHSIEETAQVATDLSFIPLKSKIVVPHTQLDHFSHDRNLMEQPEPDSQESMINTKSRVNSYDLSLDESAEPQVPSKPLAHAKTRSDLDFGTANSSKRTSGVFSFSESMAACTDYASPQNRFSQPMTPSVSEFGEFILDAFHFEDSESHEHSAEDSVKLPNRFPGYNLPEAQHASAITLRAEPSSRSKRPALDSTFENTQLVHDWNDGNEHHQKSALKDFVDEMGYLSSLIA